MKLHVEVIEKVPDEIFNGALNEISNIDWPHYRSVDTRRTASYAFVDSSISVPLRVHDVPAATVVDIEKFAEYIECKNTVASNFFPLSNLAAAWVFKQVQGEKIGRIQIVKMLANTSIASHIDPGPYFKFYSRFHIPFVTNGDVKFTGEEGDEPIGMPRGYLCQLDNVHLHGVTNTSSSDRIHMIVDIFSRRYPVPLDRIVTI